MKINLTATTWTCMNTGHKIEVAKINDDGSLVFAIRNRWNDWLNKYGHWEYEPLPSSRDKAFMSRCRFNDFTIAANTLNSAIERGEQTEEKQ